MMMIARRIAGALGVLAGLAGCSSSDVPAACVMGMTRPAVVIGAVSNHSVRVLLDTGSNTLALSNDASDRLGLATSPSSRTVSVRDATGAVADDVPLVDLPGLYLGTMRVAPTRVCLLDDGPFGVDVIAGTPLMIKARWLFDGRRKIVRLLPDGDITEQVAALGYSVSGFAPLEGKVLEPKARVRLNDAEDVLCELDTGSESSYLSHEVVTALALPDGTELADQLAREASRRYERELSSQGVRVTKVSKVADEGHSTGVLGQHTQYPLYRLDRLELAGALVNEVVVREAEECRLGWDVLGELPWVFDGPGNRVWVLSRR